MSYEYCILRVVDTVDCFVKRSCSSTSLFSFKEFSSCLFMLSFVFFFVLLLDTVQTYKKTQFCFNSFVAEIYSRDLKIYLKILKILGLLLILRKVEGVLNLYLY